MRQDTEQGQEHTRETEAEELIGRPAGEYCAGRSEGVSPPDLHRKPHGSPALLQGAALLPSSSPHRKTFNHVSPFSLMLTSPEEYFYFALFCCVFKGKMLMEGCKTHIIYSRELPTCYLCTTLAVELRRAT